MPTDYLDLGERLDYRADIHYVLRAIRADYGDIVSVDDKLKTLLKFGRNPSVTTTASTLWYHGQDLNHEVLPAANTNSIDTISSTSGDDTEVVIIEGHTESGGEKVFVAQSATLDGQNKVTLSTPLNRVNRLYNTGGTELVGQIYIYENTAIVGGAPSDDTKVHLRCPAGAQQSQKAATALSNVDYWIVTRATCQINQKASAYGDVSVEVKLSGGVFRPRVLMSCSSTGSDGEYIFDPYLVIPKNADVRLKAVSGTAGGVDISGTIEGYLAKIQT